MPDPQYSEETGNPATPKPAARLCLLGGVTLSGGTATVTRLPTRRSLALLALLAEARGRPLRRERLAEMLWPRGSQASARASLRQELAVLRRVLSGVGIGTVRADQDTIALDLAGVAVDFHTLAAAAPSDAPAALGRVSALYRGDFLDSLRPPTPEFEDWLAQLRRHLRDRITDIRLALLRHVQQRGDVAGIKTAARLLLTVDPAQETAHRALMRIYLATGQRPRALQQYELCRKILRAELDVAPQPETEDLAASLRTDPAGAAPLAPDPAPHPAAPPPVEPAEPERRNVCVLAVMFGNVEELLHSDDAEEFQEVLSQAHRTVAAILADLRGTVIAGGGNTVFACFGHEHADEHDVERGIMAARRLTRQAQRDLNLSLTCGIDYGQALVDRRSGGFAVSGLPVLRTDRIVKSAPGPGVWMTGAAQDVAGGLFDTERVPGGDGGEPGFALWQITGARAIANRFETCRLDQTLTRFVGRELERSRLTEVWQQAAGGRFRAVAITGEAGIGKSRLVHQFLQDIAGGAATVLQAQGSPHHTATPLYPFRQLLADGRTADAEGAGVAGVQAALSACLRRRLRGGPAVLVVEDAQWLDPTSLGFLAEIGALLADRPALLIATARGDAPDLLPGIDRLALGRLTTYEAWDLGAALLHRPVGDAGLARLLDRSDGIPLQIEELCRTVALGPAGAAPEGATPDIPGSLRASLFSRIDQLNEEKALLRAAAVLGRSFDHRRLAQITGLDDAQLVPLLDTLLERKFLLRTGLPPHAFYEFRNCLVQEVVLASCLRKRRADLHARAARIQEAEFHAGTPAAAAAAAWHYGQAGLTDQVVAWSLTAARQAIALSAHREAVRHLQTGAAELDKMPAGGDRDAIELQVLGLLGPQMLATEGFAAQAVEAVYERVRALAEAGPAMAGIDVLWGLWSFFVVRARLDRARSIAAEFRQLAAQSEDAAVQAASDYMTGVSHFYANRLPDALDRFSRALTRHADTPEADSARRFGISLPVACWSYTGWIHALRGNEHGAQAAAEAAVQGAERARHSFSIAFAHVFAACGCLFQDRTTAAVAHISVALSLAQEHGLRQIEAQALICQGRVQSRNGNRAGVAKLREGLEKYCATGAGLARPYALCWIAEDHLRRRALGPAEKRLNQARDHAVATGERHYDAELARLRAKLAQIRRGTGRMSGDDGGLRRAGRSLR